MGSEPGPGQPVRLGGRLFAGTDLAVVAIAHQVPGSSPDGADLVEVDAGGDPDPFVRELRERHPELVIAVRTASAGAAERAVAAGADVLTLRPGGDPAIAELAAATGTGLICPDPERAATLGVRRDGIIADLATALGTTLGAALDPAAARRTGDLSAAGWPVLVTLPDGTPDGGEPSGRDLDGALAAAVVLAERGARFFRARRTLATRQALDMLATIRGDRPPAAARRGLA